MKDDPHQSKLVHIRTILPVSVVVAQCKELFGKDEIEMVWATHDDGNVPHCHVVLRFAGVRRWQCLYDWMMANDPHSFTKAARSWPRQVRYLLHLDNPEKPPVKRSALGWHNVDEDDLSLLLAGRASGLLDAINASMSMSPIDAFSYLVEKRGFKPGECISGVRLLRELEGLKHVRASVRVSAPLSPESPEEKDDEALEWYDDQMIEESIAALDDEIDDTTWSFSARGGGRVRE